VTALALAIRYEVQSAIGRRPLTDPGAPTVVSLTSHGSRVGRVHLSIESIGRGKVLPGKLILWIDSEDLLDALARPRIARLIKRGLEVRRGVRAYRAHNKYYNWTLTEEDGYLVVADDDVFYPRRWLESLWRTFEETSRAEVVGHLVKLPKLTIRGIAPYSDWADSSDRSGRLGGVALGVSGVIFPDTLRKSLARAGTEFLGRAPLADDIWIAWCALKAGVFVRQCGVSGVRHIVVPFTQTQQLAHENVLNGQNDRQVLNTYTDADIKSIRASRA